MLPVSRTENATAAVGMKNPGEIVVATAPADATSVGVRARDNRRGRFVVSSRVVGAHSPCSLGSGLYAAQTGKNERGHGEND